MKRYAFAVLAVILAGALAAQPRQYIVKDGETLYGIAHALGVTLPELLEFNEIETPELILPGTVLAIPGSEEAAPEMSTHVVVPGETLYGIALHYETTVAEVRSYNNLREDDVLRVGQRLHVPVRESSERPEKDRDEETRPRPEAVPVSRTVADQIPFSDGETWPVNGEKETLEGKLPGVMIFAQPGTPVRAVAGGRVVYQGPHSSFGNVVFVESVSGYIYVYGGQDSVAVQVGETVNAGTRLGTTGLLPGEQGAALYFSVWRNNEFIDPAAAPRG